MTDSQTWYLVKHLDGHCHIIPSDQATEEKDSAIQERWGPFTSQNEALARRVGLIRAGKCQPL